jgi:hypothetical protein
MRDPKEIAREFFKRAALYPDDMSEAFAITQREAWDAAIEAAAKLGDVLCEELAQLVKQTGGRYNSYNEGRADGIEQFQAAIRAIPYPEKP